MTKDFEQLSIKAGFMKHNGGLFYRQLSETESEFKASVNEYHQNAAGVTHGGYIHCLNNRLRRRYWST